MLSFLGRGPRRAVSILAAALALILTLPVAAPVGGAPAFTQEAAAPDVAPPAWDLMPFDVDARAAVLMDAHTGQVLYAKNPDEKLAPASLTKIMTMLLALEDLDAGRVKLSDQAEVSEAAWRLSLQGRRGGVSAMFLEVGQRVTVEELLYGIGVASGNDASLVLAEFLAGSEEAFVRRMNQRAAELGLRDTHFLDSHGLSPEATTTAADMARLAAFFVRTQHDGLVYASRPEYTFAGIPQPNRNGLVVRDPRVTGLKTGYLSVAGYHLVATAEEGDMSLVAAVLGTASDADRERVVLELLNHGFRNFRTVSPAADLAEKRVRVYKGQAADVVVRPRARPVVTVPADLAGDLTWHVDLPAYLEAPLAEGQAVGRLEARSGERVIAAFDLVTATKVDRAGFLKVALDSVRLFVTRLLGRR